MPVIRIRMLRPFSWLVLLHAAILILALTLLIRQKGHAPSGKEQIVIVPIDGVITTGRGSLGPGMSVYDIVDTLDSMQDDESVKAVVLRINSPGGSVGAVQEIHRSVVRLRSKGKFVVSTLGDVAASGGYYVACAGDKIVSNPGTLTGSIGVIMETPDVQGLLRKIGVGMRTFKSGAMKDSGSPFRDMSDAEKAYFKDVVDDAYRQFFDAVRLGRKMDPKTLRPLADGRIFSGAMAYNHKLVDQLGGLEEAIDIAKRATGLEDKNPAIVQHSKSMSLERLLDMFSKTPVRELAELQPSGARLMYVMQ